MNDYEGIQPVAELPPPTRKGRPVQRFVGAAEIMRSAPGEWFAIDRSPRSQTASNLRAGKYAAIPRGEFEIESRKIDGEFVIYARKPIEGEK
jgi:hypothetical protein